LTKGFTLQSFDILTPYFITNGLNPNFSRQNFFTVNDTVILNNNYITLTTDLFKDKFNLSKSENINIIFYKFFSTKDLFRKLSLPNKSPLYFSVENKFFKIKLEKSNFSYERINSLKPFGVFFNFEYLLSEKYFDKILEYLCSKKISILKNILTFCYEINFNINPPKAYIIKINKGEELKLLYYLSTLCHQNIIISNFNELLNLSEDIAAFLLNNSISLHSPIVIKDISELSDTKAQKIANILKGSKINVNSSIQKNICYKNNVSFIFIDYGISDFKNLNYNLKDNNIPITRIDLTYIDFDSYFDCFPKFYQYHIQIFSFACALYGHYLNTNKPAKKKIIMNP